MGSRSFLIGFLWRKETRMKKKRRHLRNIWVRILTAVLPLIIIFTFILNISIHSGNSMYPAIRDGDLLVTFKLGEPVRNDVVVYEINGIKKTGRVIAVGGDTVEITEDGMLLINSIQTSEEIFYATFVSQESGIQYPYYVEEGTCFILNDFRSDAGDSREYGNIQLGDITGPVIFVIRRRGF